MVEILNYKYVFHVPLYKLKNNELITINQEIIDELLNLFISNDYNLYITKIKGFYNKNIFDEIIITIFTNSNDELLIKLFKSWFIKNNNSLEQDSFAYEINNKMYIEKLSN